MSERLRIGGNLRNRKAAVVPAVFALAIAGCGAGGSNLKVNDHSIQPCASRAYDEQSGKTAVSSNSLAEILATTKADVVTLQQRALSDNGSIGLDNYPGTDTTEVTATHTSLTLSFPRYNNFWGNWRHDEVTFVTKNGEPPLVLPGAVACSAAGSVYPNGTYQTLQRDIQQTTELSR